MGIVKGRHSLILLSCRYGPSSSFLPQKFSTALKPRKPVQTHRKGHQHTHNSRYPASNTLLPDVPLTSRKMGAHKATSTASAPSTTPNPLRQSRRGSRTRRPASTDPLRARNRELKRSRSPPLHRLSYRTRETPTVGPQLLTPRDSTQTVPRYCRIAPKPTATKINQVTSNIEEQLADDQRRRIAENAAALVAMGMVRSDLESLSVQSTELTGDLVYDTQTDLCLGDSQSREVRLEGFCTVEELLEYERQHNPSIRHFRLPVQDPLTGRWNMLQTPMVDSGQFAGHPENDPEIRAPQDGGNTQLTPHEESLARLLQESIGNN